MIHKPRNDIRSHAYISRIILILIYKLPLQLVMLGLSHTDAFLLKIELS